ncbi:polysaccharide deacetylase family protein [Maribacter aurantiacus]|uniref:Polysaccharide deacetylase family protein n=1 Tax=Maribacter aurantiacus TaxID=1882343 RepID=A0A5R8M792_9FLAO|nr:polysaccharide deacetylase family protein [Maribacter aurantiacus]TLF45365.1 polysaccharide deacetylase family protein [Maribacter aurantiacus]
MLTRKTVNTIFLLGLVFSLVISIFKPIPWPAFALLMASWFLLTLGGSFFIRWNYHMTSLNSNNEINKPQVAITFDDGPHPEYTPKALSLLEKYNAKATFFCIGKNIEKHPEQFKEIIRRGHSVGNHTFSHANTFGFFGTEKVMEELTLTNKLVEGISGLKMALYRPAFGVTNPSIARAVKKLGLKTIGWNVRSLDTTFRNEDQVLKRITSRTQNGAIILLHDTSAKSIAVLERLLVFLEERKLQSVTVDQMFQIRAYE